MKSTVLVLIATVLCLSLEPVFAGGGQEAAAGAPTELVVWGPGGVAEAFWRSTMERFDDANDRVKVRYETPLTGLEISQSLQKIRLSVQTGSGPDVAITDAVGQALREIVATGNVYALDEAYTTYGWNNRIYKGAIDSITIEGKKMAVSLDIEVVGMFYNKSAFNEAGVSPPETFDDFLSVLGKLSKAGYGGTAIGLKGGWPSALMASEYMYISAGLDYIKTMRNEQRWVDCSDCLRGLQKFRSLVDLGLANDFVVGIDVNQSRDLFMTGKAATILEGPWFIKSVKMTQPDFEVGFFGIPPINPKSEIQVLGGVGTSAMVLKKDNPAKERAAFDLINELVSPDTAVRKAVELGEITPIDFPLTEQMDPLTREIAGAITRYGEKVGYWPVYHLPAPVFRKLNSYIQGLMNGELTPMQVLQEMDKARREYDAQQKG